MSAPARIGPNSLIQTVAAMREMLPELSVRAVLVDAGQPGLLHASPQSMVEESLFVSLVTALRRAVGCLSRETLFAFASHHCKRLRDWAVLLEAMSERPDHIESLQRLLAQLRARFTDAQYLAVLPDAGAISVFLSHRGRTEANNNTKV